MKICNLYVVLMAVIVVAAVPKSTLLGQQRDLIWKSLLPDDVQSSILWYGDHEEGSLYDWQYEGDENNNGGGIFCTGPKNEAFAEMDQRHPFTGKYCVKTTIRHAVAAGSGSRAVRLMRWTERPWDQGGKFFPKSAYYGVWIRFDKHYRIGDPTSGNGGWWNVFQFKSDDENGNSQPVWVLNVGNQGQSAKEMNFYLYSDQNRPSSISQVKPLPIPVNRWFHVEVLYKQSHSNTADGNLSVWQDGKLILSADRVKTILDHKLVWGVGNYTDQISGGVEPGAANVFFDDATVSTKPTHPYVSKTLKLRK